MQLDIVLATPDELTDADLLEIYEIDREIWVETKPEVPVQNPDAWLAAQRVERPEHHRVYALAREKESGGDRLVGVGWMGWTLGAANRHLARAHVSVPAAHRRRGVGGALLAAVGRHAQADGRTLLQSWTGSEAPSGEAFCEVIGAKRGMPIHENKLDLKQVDRGLLEEWVRAGESLPDYELVVVEPPTPPELLAAAAEIANVMNTAPRDDLNEEDETITPEMIAAWDRAHLAGGRGRRRLYAKHRDGDGYVGLTEMNWELHDRRVLVQGDTGVLPQHRGHGLGKWLKAAMLLWVLDTFPEAEAVFTGNAMSNDAMLAINFALGFRPVGSWIAWELETEKAVGYTSRQSARLLE